MVHGMARQRWQSDVWRGWLLGGRRRMQSLASALVLLILLAVATPWVACVSRPPRNPDDICSIFREKRSWYHSSKQVAERWAVPESVQLAIVHQESSFRATARPPRRRFLWVFPGARPSSAYGYGQVVDSTWQQYRDHTDRLDASRADFADAVDFIGWYADQIHLRTGIPKSDAARLYLAYHEGPAGYSRGSHHSKGWLRQVAGEVGRRARRYQGQIDQCRDRLGRRRFLGIF
jgi:hypothetical protein